MKLYFQLLFDINQHDINLILGFVSYVAKEQSVCLKSFFAKAGNSIYLFIF